MNRSDFLIQLKKALEGKLNAQELQEQIEYYDAYIREEVRSGKSEQEVLELLGDPWAIAKTIQMSAGINHTEYEYSETREVNEQNKSRERSKVHVFGLNTWWKKVAAIVGLLVILFIIISIVLGILTLVVPIVIPVVLILFLLRTFRKK